MEQENVPALARDAGQAPHRRRCSTLPGVADVRGAGLLARGRARRRASTPAGGRRALPRPRARGQRGDADRRCASRRRCSSPTTRSTRRSRSSRRSSRGAHEPSATSSRSTSSAHAELATLLDTMAAWKADPGLGAAGARRPRRGAACSRSRRPARATAARWRSSALGGHPVTIRPDEISIDDARDGRGRRPHARRVLQRSSRRGCSTTACSSAWPPSSTSRSSTCSRTARTRARRWPTC